MWSWIVGRRRSSVVYAVRGVAYVTVCGSRFDMVVCLYIVSVCVPSSLSVNEVTVGWYLPLRAVRPIYRSAQLLEISQDKLDYVVDVE